VAISLKDRVTAFLAPSRSSLSAGTSLSLARAQQSWSLGYGGLVGKRVANSDAILAKHGSGDISLWADIHDDERAFSCFQQRRLAVINRDWTVDPGGSDRKSKKAAEHLSDQLKTLGRTIVTDGVEVVRVGGWDQVSNKMLFGIWYGYAVGEMVWGIGEDGLVRIERIDVPDRSWFGFDATNRLRITDAMGVRDEEVPPRKFWAFTSGADHDFAPYGVGLAHWLFWPVFFKRQGLPFWLTFLEKFGSPTVVGKTGEGQLDTAEGRSKVIDILRSIVSFGVTAIPSWLNVELLSAANAGEAGYERLIDRCDGMITRVILSQTMTTDDGSSRSQAEVHMDVRDEVVKSDADLLCESFNQGPAVWLTEWNFPGAKPPRVYRVMEDPEDLDTVAERDGKLKGLGWHRTQESFAEVYGEGYEYREPKPLNLGGEDEASPTDAPEFAAVDIDAIDRLVTAMAEEGNASLAAFLAPLKDRLAGVTNPEIARIAMLDFIETMDTQAFAKALADPMLAVRAAAEAGVDVERIGA
jgi:phage gp29-like protein